MIDRSTLRLYLVVSPDSYRGEDLAGTVQATIAAGVTCVQLRWKSVTDREVLQLARALLAVTRSSNVPLIVNDRVDIALAAGANGVHLGVDDLPLADARRLAGPNFIIGYSPESDEQIATSAEHASYLGIGPFFSTATKLDAGTALGAAEFARRRNLSQLPTVAIGGITLANAPEPIAAGADGIAVVSAILGAPDPVQATRDLRREARPLAT